MQKLLSVKAVFSKENCLVLSFKGAFWGTLKRVYTYEVCF